MADHSGHDGHLGGMGTHSHSAVDDGADTHAGRLGPAPLWGPGHARGRGGGRLRRSPHKHPLGWHARGGGGGLGPGRPRPPLATARTGCVSLAVGGAGATQGTAAPAAWPLACRLVLLAQVLLLQHVPLAGVRGHGHAVHPAPEGATKGQGGGQSPRRAVTTTTTPRPWSRRPATPRAVGAHKRRCRVGLDGPGPVWGRGGLHHPHPRRVRHTVPAEQHPVPMGTAEVRGSGAQVPSGARVGVRWCMEQEGGGGVGGGHRWTSLAPGLG